MSISVGSVENHREREKGALIYPVYSRRSKGLSAGINLFPDRKVCSFDCAYCEVFPFKTDQRFSLELMEEALVETLARARDQGMDIKDICVSGNGEPTQSPHFAAALETAARIRSRDAPSSSLVLITNGTGLQDDRMFDLLVQAASGPIGLDIWLKVDAGSSAWYEAMDRCALPFKALSEKIKAFTALAPVTIQTMICAVKGKTPSPEEAAAWESLILDLAAGQEAARQNSPEANHGIKTIQIYGKARPSPLDPLAEALPESILEARAASLRAALKNAGSSVPVEVYQ